MQHYEGELGERIRRQRKLVHKSSTREEFCEKNADVLCGLTPEMLRDIERGMLFGEHELEHITSLAQLLWEAEADRIEMIRIGTFVIQRRREQKMLLESPSSVPTSVMKVGIPFVMGKPERPRLGRLDHRGGRY